MAFGIPEGPDQVSKLSSVYEPRFRLLDSAMGGSADGWALRKVVKVYGTDFSLL